MPNMSLKKNEMPSQEPNVRNKNFLEVALGYTEEQALDEAARCLNCKNHPCVSGCPVQVKIPEFIKKITEKDYEGAYQVIHETSSLPAVCGPPSPRPTATRSRSSAPAPAASPARATLPRRATMSPFLKRSTLPAACWSTASPSSDFPRPSCRRKSTA